MRKRSGILKKVKFPPKKRTVILIGGNIICMRGNGFIAIKRNVYILKPGYVTAFPSDSSNPAAFLRRIRGLINYKRYIKRKRIANGFRYPFFLIFRIRAERLSFYTPSTAIARPTNTRRESASTIVVINGLATTAGSR